MQLKFNNNPFEKARDAFKSSSPTAKTFDEHKANFENSRLGRQVEKAFIPLPYELENKGLYRMAGGLSYACQLISVTAAASFAFAFIFSRINVFSGAWYVAFGLSGAALFVIEYLLRKESAPVTRKILLGQFSAKLWRRVAFVVVLTGLGITSSYLGGFDTAAAVATAAPVFSAPESLAAPVIDLDKIADRYAAQISDAKKAAAAYKKDRLWKNRLSMADANKHRKLLAVATSKENDLNNEIKAATVTNAEQREKTIQENNNRSGIAKNDYNQLTLEHDNRINQNGGGLAYLSVLCQFIFFCCCFYQSHYLIETVKQYSTPAPTDDTSGGGGRKRKANTTNEGDGFRDILPNLDDNVNGIYNASDRFVLNGSKRPKLQLQINATNKNQTDKRDMQTVFISSDLTIEHTDKQTGKIKRLNISQVRGNIAANNTRLRKAKQTGTDRQVERIESLVTYWIGKQDELISKAAANEIGKAVG